MTVVKAVQPAGLVYVTAAVPVAVPTGIPVTIPPEPTLTAVDEALQVPLPDEPALVNVIVEPEQTAVGPDMGDTLLMTSVVVVVQPEPRE